MTDRRTKAASEPPPDPEEPRYSIRVRAVLDAIDPKRRPSPMERMELILGLADMFERNEQRLQREAQPWFGLWRGRRRARG